MRVIRAFHMEEEETEAFRNRNQELTAMQTFVGRISGLMNPVTYVMINGALIVLIAVTPYGRMAERLHRGKSLRLSIIWDRFWWS